MMYSENQITLEKEDDFKSQVLTVNSPVNMRRINNAVETDPFHLIRDLISCQ